MPFSDITSDVLTSRSPDNYVGRFRALDGDTIDSPTVAQTKKFKDDFGQLAPLLREFMKDQHFPYGEPASYFECLALINLGILWCHSGNVRRQVGRPQMPI